MGEKPPRIIVINGPDAPYQWRLNLKELCRIRFGRPVRKFSGNFFSWGLKQPEYVLKKVEIESLLTGIKTNVWPQATPRRFRVP